MAYLGMINRDNADAFGAQRYRFKAPYEFLRINPTERDDIAGRNQWRSCRELRDAVGDVAHKGVLSEGNEELQMGGARGQVNHAFRGQISKLFRGLQNALPVGWADAGSSVQRTINRGG